MSQLAGFEFEGQTIRCTPEGQPSVFDMVKVLGGKKSPHEVWKRLCEQYPDILTKCEFVSFPDSLGRKGRPTPVAKDKEAAYYILGLLPGAAGKTYREQAASLFVRYLSADTTLAEDVVRRSDNLEGVQRVADAATSKAKYLRAFHGLGAQLKDRGCTGRDYALVHGTNNRLAGVEKGKRQSMTNRQEKVLTLLQLAEELVLDTAPIDIRERKAAVLCVNTANSAIRLVGPAV